MAELLKPDICVIGAGAGGLAVASAAAALGAQVVLVERGRLGGDRLHAGSVPSNALIAAAQRAHEVARAHLFGVDVEAGAVEFGRVREHMRGIAAALAPNDSKERYIGLGVRVLEGVAKFIDPRTVAVGEIRIRARRVVIATGSAPAPPPIAGLDATPYLTNETVFDLDHCPAHLVVIGAGAVGLELAQAFHRLGAEVTVLDGSAGPLAREEPECAQIVLDSLTREGIVFRTSVTIERVGEIQLSEEQTGEPPQPAEVTSREMALADVQTEGQSEAMHMPEVPVSPVQVDETPSAGAQVAEIQSSDMSVTDVHAAAALAHADIIQSEPLQAGESQPGDAPSEARADETQLALDLGGDAPAGQPPLPDAPAGVSHAGETPSNESHASEAESNQAPQSDAQAEEPRAHDAQTDESQAAEPQTDGMPIDAAPIEAARIDEPEHGHTQPDDIPSEPALAGEPQAGERSPNVVRSWLEIDIATPDGKETIAASHILIAAGRRPNLEGLGLDAARIKFEPGGIVVSHDLKTTNKRVYAVGDVTGTAEFTHAASHHADLVVRNALFRQRVRVNDGAIPRVMFTDPEFAHVGLTETQARDRGNSICVLRWPYQENDRAQAERATIGHIKVVTDKKGRILGATIVGASAGELITAWSLAISQNLNIRAFAGTVVPYPTLSEIGKRAAITYFTPRLTSPWVRRIIAALRLFR